MSNLGQAALTIVGTAVGYMVGYPALGFYLGSLAGSVIFPTQLPGQKGPRLLDLTVQTSTIGTPIPIVYGTYAIAGNIIWSSGLLETETTEEVGGKGGPTQSVTTYSYRVSLAIGLCEGPIIGIRRVWADSTLIFDITNPDLQLDSSGSVTIDFGDGFFQELFARLAASNTFDNHAEVYLGTEDQMPDPTIEAYEGIGNVQAFRGLAYIVLTNFQLEQYGNRIPNFRVEVVRAGNGDCPSVIEYANETLYPWINADPPINSLNDHEFRLSEGNHWAPPRGPIDTSAKETLGEALAAASANANKSFPIYSGYRTLRGDDAGVVTRIGGSTVEDFDTVSVWLHYSSETYELQVAKDFRALSEYMGFTSGFEVGMKWWSNGDFSQGTWGSGAGVYLGIPQTGTLPVPVGYDAVITGNPYLALARDALIEVRRIPRAPSSACEDGSSLGAEGWCVFPDGTLSPAIEWERVNGAARVLQRLSIVSSEGRDTVVTYPLGPVRPFGHAQYDDQAFWEDAYDVAVSAGTMEAGLIYGVDYPVTQSFYYQREIEICTIDSLQVTLASIVQDLCARVNLTQVDVTDLEEVLVSGYVIGRTMSARDAIEGTRAYGFFDAVESDGLAKFVTRGHAPAMTIPEEDLGAYEATTERPSVMNVTRKLDFEIPRMVRVHYAMPERNYEAGEQYSSRLTGESVDILDVQIAIAMTDTKAKQISEVLLYDQWTSRNSYRFSLDHRYAMLEPTDVILLPVEGNLERVRITSIDYSLPTLMTLEALRDDDGVYASEAIGNVGAAPGSEISIVVPTILYMLDIPALRDVDDEAGYYIVARPVMDTSSWRGAVVFRSPDGGSSWSQAAAVTNAGRVGQVVSALPSGPSTVIDEGNTLRVQLFNNAELESRTETEILNGANAAAIGADGRWEIIQFHDAEVQLDGSWVLSRLMRGRRGTEHNIGLSQSGDTFVMLSVGGVVRLTQENAAIGAERILKPVTIGAAFTDDETVYPFTGHGVALKPFSPVFVAAVFEENGDITISWIRRGRLSQELRDGADIPLSEASERYQVDIIDESTEAVIRTLEVTAQLATYTAAQQAIDFPQPPGQLSICVYQMSEIVGRGYAGCAVVEVAGEGEVVVPPSAIDDDAIIFVGDVLESDVNALLDWERLGDGPRLSAYGFVGDGYEARYLADLSVSGSPAYLSSSSGAVTLRAAMTPYFGSKHATADRAVSLCVNDATANPKLELAVVDDATAPGEPQAAARSYTGAMQTQRMCRRNWRFEFTFPQKTEGSDEARPLGVAVTPLGILVAAHFEGASSVAFMCDQSTGEQNGSFDFGATYLEVTSVAYRDSDGTYWAADYGTGNIIRFNPATSIANTTVQLNLTFEVFADDVLGAIAWATVDDVEYLLALEYRTSGTPYLYVIDPADVVNLGTFNTNDRIKRIEVPTFSRGVAVDADGMLYLSVASSAVDGLIYKIDLAAALSASTDSEPYTDFLVPSLVSQILGPSQMLGDLDVDSGGRIWCPTEGMSSAGDDQAFLAVWSSGLTYSEFNVYQLRYDGAGTVTIKINDKLFTTQSWTPTVTPGAISIGGPPTATAGQANGFVSARVHNVLIQGSDLDIFDPYDLAIYGVNAPESWPMPIQNPDAESGTAGWTVETGALSTLDASSLAVDPKFGEFYFYGGTITPSLVRQRFDLEDLIESAAEDFEVDGDAWVILEWWGSGFQSQGDYGRGGIRFLDEASVEISEDYAPAFVISPEDTFVYRSWSIEVPANTRYIDVLMEMVRIDGTNNNGHWDEIVATLHRKPMVTPVESLWLGALT